MTNLQCTAKASLKLPIFSRSTSWCFFGVDIFLLRKTTPKMKQKQKRNPSSSNYVPMIMCCFLHFWLTLGITIIYCTRTTPPVKQYVEHSPPGTNAAAITHLFTGLLVRPKVDPRSSVEDHWANWRRPKVDRTSD